MLPVHSATVSGEDERARRRARMATALAWLGWAALSLGCGVAVALAQYASLADAPPDRLDRAAALIAIGGAVVATVAWLWWLVVNVGRWRAGVPSADTSGGPGCGFFLWIAVGVGGFAIMAAGGNADSTAPPALLALGGGCACAIGGFLALFASCGRWLASERREDQLVRAAVRAAARAEGREIADPPWFATALSVVGFIVPATALIGCYALGPWAASALRVPLAAGAALIVVPAVVLCFPALAYFVGTQTRAREVVTPGAARAYAHRAAGLATAAFVAIGVLPLLHLGWLVVVVFFGLAMLAGRLRGRYLGRL